MLEAQEEQATMMVAVVLFSRARSAFRWQALASTTFYYEPMVAGLAEQVTLSPSLGVLTIHTKSFSLGGGEFKDSDPLHYFFFLSLMLSSGSVLRT